MTRREMLAWPGAAVLLQSGSPLAIHDVTLIDGAGAVLPRRTVVVAGDRVSSIRQATDPLPANARAVDGRGRFLIPGLWDMHVHLSYTKASALPALLANGVTSVADMGGLLREIDEWRAAIANGTIPGPRIYRAGPVLNGRPFAFQQFVVNSGPEARAAVRALHKAGGDFIKTHRAMLRDAHYGVAEEARDLGLAHCGHIPQVVTPEEASDSGQRTFEHVATLFEGTFSAGLAEGELARAIARFRTSGEAARLFAKMAKNGTWVTPTLVVSEAAPRMREPVADPRDVYVSQSARKISEDLRVKYKDTLTPQQLARWRAEYAELLPVVGEMHAAGVGLLTGTDLASAVVYPGFSVHDELALLVQAGVPAAEAIHAGTRNPARALRLNEVGTIQPGKAADMVLLDADPLADIRNTRRIRAVVSNGRLYDRPALDALLATARAQAARG